MDKFEFRAGEQRTRRVREDHATRATANSTKATIVPKDALRAGQRPDRSLGRRAGQGHEAQAGHAPARSSWASPRRRCSRAASSRPPASRKRPRCSPKRPWPARSTPGRPEGKRHPRPLDPGRHWLQALQESEVRISEEALAALEDEEDEEEEEEEIIEEEAAPPAAESPAAE